MLILGTLFSTLLSAQGEVAGRQQNSSASRYEIDGEESDDGVGRDLSTEATESDAKLTIKKRMPSGRLRVRGQRRVGKQLDLKEDVTSGTRKHPQHVHIITAKDSSAETSADEEDAPATQHTLTTLDLSAQGEKGITLSDPTSGKSMQISRSNLSSLLQFQVDKIEERVAKLLSHHNSEFLKQLQKSFEHGDIDFMHYLTNVLDGPFRKVFSYYLLTDVVYVNLQPLNDLKTFEPYRYYIFLEKLKQEEEKYTSQVSALDHMIRLLNNFLVPIPLATESERVDFKSTSNQHLAFASNPAIIEKTISFLKESLKDILDPDTLLALSQQTGTSLWQWISQIREAKRAMTKQLSFLKYQIRTLESDPIFKYYFYKMSPHNSLRAYTPVLIMYRHQQDPKGRNDWGITATLKRTVASIKDNPAAKQERGEPSGMALLKKSDSLSKEDELIFSFSGSNSSNDWLANFNSVTSNINLGHIFSAGVQSRYLPGITGNPGIFMLFHTMMTSSEGPLTDFLELYTDEAKHRIRHSNKPFKVKLVTTGHSLGGALALLMGYYLNHVIKPYILQRIPNAEVSIQIYTYGTPAILDQPSSIHYEKTIGAQNILRTHVIGDPIPYVTEAPAARVCIVGDDGEELKSMNNALNQNIKQIIEGHVDLMPEDQTDSATSEPPVIMGDASSDEDYNSPFIQDRSEENSGALEEDEGEDHYRSTMMGLDIKSGIKGVLSSMMTPVNWLQSFLHNKFVGSYWHVGMRTPLIDGLQFFANRNASAKMLSMSVFFQGKIKKMGVMTRHGRDFYRHVISNNLKNWKSFQESLGNREGIRVLIQEQKKKMDLSHLNSLAVQLMKEFSETLSGSASLDRKPQIQLLTETWNDLLTAAPKFRSSEVPENGHVDSLQPSDEHDSALGADEDEYDFAVGADAEEDESPDEDAYIDAMAPPTAESQDNRPTEEDDEEDGYESGARR